MSEHTPYFAPPAPPAGSRDLDPETKAALDHLVEAESGRLAPTRPADPHSAPVVVEPPEPEAVDTEPVVVEPPEPDVVRPPEPDVLEEPADAVLPDDAEPEAAVGIAAGHVLPTTATENGAPPGLRAQRRDQRHRRRRTTRFGALALILVAALVVALVVGLQSRHPHHVAPVAARTQQTLLLGIGSTGQPAQSVVLLAADTDGSGAGMLIPSGTIVDGPGNTVGGSYDIAPAAEFSGAVSDLLGVTVDATWRLTPAGLAALVNQVGGITVTVDQAINTPGLVLAPGPQQLSGAQAAAYATYVGAQTQQAGLNRTRLVFDAILAKLPPRAGLTPLIGSLAANSTSTWTPTQLAAFLTRLKGSTLVDNESILPVTPLDTGASTQSYGLNAAAATTAISAAFGPSLLRDHGAVGTRVQIVNDSGRPGLATSARAKLSAHQLTFVRAVNDKPFHQYTRSAVLVFDSSPQSIAFGHRVAAALGLPDAPVLVSTQKTGVADAIAVLANDYVS